jgi:hypothetical protein
LNLRFSTATPENRADNENNPNRPTPRQPPHHESPPAWARNRSLIPSLACARAHNQTGALRQGGSRAGRLRSALPENAARSTDFIVRQGGTNRQIAANARDGSIVGVLSRGTAR